LWRVRRSVADGVGAAAIMGRVTVLIRMLISVQVRTAQRAVECHIHRGTPYHDGASWLAHQVGCAVATAHLMLRTAARLEACPDTADALDDGQWSLEEADAVSSASKVDPAAERDLVERATRNHDLGQTRERSAHIRNATHSAEQAAARQARQARLRGARRFSEFVDDEGMAGVAGRFMPADYAAVKAIIDASQKPIFEQARRVGRHDETPAAHRADAVMAMAAAASTIRSVACRWSQSLSQSADRSRVVVDGELERRHLDRRHRPGRAATPHWARPAASPASATSRSTGSDRSCPANVRDGFSCVIRGCHRNRRVERDHRDQYAATHDTSYANLGLLCDLHHDEKTHPDSNATATNGGGTHHRPRPAPTRPTIRPRRSSRGDPPSAKP
jgi:hypothetical protein